jgi:hypothetical protein
MRQFIATQDTQQVGVLYILTSINKTFEDIGIKEVYGIEIKSGGAREKIDDISANKKIVTSFLFVLNKEQCSPIHLMDVVEDFLVDQSI